MKPGRELDALVAEKVFGVPKAELVGYGYRVRVSDDGRGYTQTDLPRYSEDIAAAWEVRDAIRDMIFSKRLTFKRELQLAIRARLDHEFLIAPEEVILFVEPVDICLAALKAVGAWED